MNTSDPSRRGELEFIRRLQPLLEPSAPGPSPHQSPPALVGFGDDMSMLEPATSLLWTVDMIMDGVDFDSSKHSWENIGRKAMAVNLSDCAAMAVMPIGALCAVSLANSLSMDNALDLHRGAHAFGLNYGCPILGGDTNSWDAPTAISISVAARCPAGQAPVRRDGARPNDRIYLTGRVGGSILGRHLTFEPRIETALGIAGTVKPHAMIDISDGLSLDLSRILEASECGAVLDERNLEAAVHPDAERLSEQDGQPPREHALHDGEDFELVVVVPAETPEPACEELGLLPIGHITEERSLVLQMASGQCQPIPIRGWEHFR